MNTLQLLNETQILPKDYQPTEQIIFCGNKILNYRFLIDDRGFYPILIGTGEIPRIWLYIRTPKNEIITLVDDSVSTFNQIKVDIFSFDKKIEIRDIKNDIIILRLFYKDIPTIDKLDLRPIGYNIFGDKSSIVLPNMTISNNTFNNVNTIIGVN